MPNSLTFQQLLDNPERYLSRDTLGKHQFSTLSNEEKEAKKKEIRSDCRTAVLSQGAIFRGQLRNDGLFGFFWLYWREQVAQKDAMREEKSFFSKYKQDFATQITDQKILSYYIKSQALFCADLSGLPLRELGFAGADLRFSNLSKCDLSDSNVNGVHFGDADLSGAKLQTATNFSQVQSLEGANLSGAEFTHEQIKGIGNSQYGLYRVIFDKEHLPADYKDAVKKQELENHIRQSYENEVNTQTKQPLYNANFLKLIQASGYSPLDWGKNPAVFQEKHDAFDIWGGNKAALTQKIEDQIKVMLNPNNLNGYAQARGVKPFNPFKWWSQKDTRAGQIQELKDLFKENDSQGLPKILPLATVAETLLKVSNNIRAENNVFKSELLKQIEQISQPDPAAYPKAEFPRGARM